jgi:hypothetical protein
MSSGKRPPPGPPIPPRPAPRTAARRPVDPIVASYKDRVADRARAHGDDQRVPVPDIAAAARDYRPDKDGPMTLANIGVAQGNIRKMTDDGEKKASLSPGTLAGLHAIHEATVQQQQGQAQAIQAASPSPAQAAQEPPTKEAPRGPLTSAPEEGKKKPVTRPDDMGDLDFDLALARMKSDVINNDKEREAVKARVKQMDLADGIVTGEFKQTVPIVPEQLVVVYRSLTPLEIEEIRKHCLEEALKDERFAEIQSDRYGFMLTVASVVMINGQEMPKHIKTKSGFERTFDWETFMRKVSLFAGYPSVFFASLSTHAHWFEMRVRELFATANVKNG